MNRRRISVNVEALEDRNAPGNFTGQFPSIEFAKTTQMQPNRQPTLLLRERAVNAPKGLKTCSATTNVSHGISESYEPSQRSSTTLMSLLNSTLTSLLHDDRLSIRIPEKTSQSTVQGKHLLTLDTHPTTGDWHGENVESSRALEGLFTSSFGATVDVAYAHPLDAILNSKPKPPVNPEVAPRALALGLISIAATTKSPTATFPDGATLPDSEKLSPGLLHSVNWSDDNNDGWNPASTRTTTAGSGNDVYYIPDKVHSSASNPPFNDRDLRKFVVNVTNATLLNGAIYDFKLTFGNNVRVYLNQNKVGDPVPDGKIWRNADMTPPTNPTGLPKVATMTFWLEGVVASTAFRDQEIKVEYVGGNIAMDKTVDTVKLTVIGVSQTGLFTGAQKADDKNWFSRDNENDNTLKRYSFNEYGKISWDMPDYLQMAEPVNQGGLGKEYCMHYHNCMTVQGNPSPPRDADNSVYYGWTENPNNYNNPQPNPATIPLVIFDLKREVYGARWERVKATEEWRTARPLWVQNRIWSDDELQIDTSKTIVPTYLNNLYFNDAPGHSGNSSKVIDYTQEYYNFRNWVTVKIYTDIFIVSDMYKWHSQILTKPNGDYSTRAINAFQKLAAGWIDVPQTYREDIETW